MAGEEGSWRTAAFRQSVVSKIDEAIQRSGMPTAKNSVEMESHVFQKAKTKEEYLSFVARLILHVRELNAKKGQGMNGPAGGAGQTMQDPINALQTLARQGTGLGPQAAGMVPQPPNQIPASNLLQTLNQRPGQPLGGLASLPNKVPDLGLGPGAQSWLETEPMAQEEGSGALNQQLLPNPFSSNHNRQMTGHHIDDLQQAVEKVLNLK